MKLMHSCKEITEQSSDYLDRHLPWWSRLGFKIHLLMCVNCNRYLDQLKLTISTIGKTKAAEAPVIDEQQVNKIVDNINHQLKE